MQYVRVEIDSVRPVDRAGNRIDRYLSEGAQIPERLVHTLLKDPIEVELAYQPVREREPQPMRTKVLHFYDPGRPDHCSRLAKGLDRNDALGLLGSLPVGAQLVSVEEHPLLDEACGRARKAAAKERAVVDPHLSLILAIDGVDMRRPVVTEVHVDHNPVELAQPRHSPTLRTACDTFRGRHPPPGSETLRSASGEIEMVDVDRVAGDPTS